MIYAIGIVIYIALLFLGKRFCQFIASIDAKMPKIEREKKQFFYDATNDPDIVTIFQNENYLVCSICGEEEIPEMGNNGKLVKHGEYYIHKYHNTE